MNRPQCTTISVEEIAINLSTHYPDQQKRTHNLLISHTEPAINNCWMSGIDLSCNTECRLKHPSSFLYTSADVL